MAWESRGKAKYFYQSRRVGAKVRKDYLGSGPIAAISAELDLRRRREREANRTARTGYVARVQDADRALDDLSRHCRVLASAVLLVNGYHNHRGEWRRRRVFRIKR